MPQSSFVRIILLILNFVKNSHLVHYIVTFIHQFYKAFAGCEKNLKIGSSHYLKLIWNLHIWNLHVSELYYINNIYHIANIYIYIYIYIYITTY